MELSPWWEFLWVAFTALIIKNTAYLYVEARLKQKVKTLLTELLQAARAENKELVIASSKGTEKLLQVIEPILQKQNYKYTKENIDVLLPPLASQKLTTGLSSSVELFGALASMNRNMGHEEEEDEENGKKKIFKKRNTKLLKYVLIKYSCFTFLFCLRSARVKILFPIYIFITTPCLLAYI